MENTHKTLESRDVMELYYGIEANGCAPQPLNEVYVDRIVNKHGAQGLAVVSANQSGLDYRINTENTRNLIADIQRTGRAYIPVYGGFLDKKTNVASGYEPSFIVTNYDRYGNVMDFEKLKAFAIKMCGRYDQHCVTINAPNDMPHSYDRNGNVVSAGDPIQTYLSSLIQTKMMDCEHPDRTKRFTRVIDQPDKSEGQDVEVVYCLNPSPCTLNERRHREAYGEIIFGQWVRGKIVI